MGGQAIAALGDPIYEAGYERDRIGPNGRGNLVIRWWMFLSVPGARLRNQRPRQGVVDRGFRFARGGRVATEEEAATLLEQARHDAQREVQYWRGQPSHALGPAGELIPLDAIIPELTACDA